MVTRRSLSTRERVRLKLPNGWRVSCDTCGTVFDIPYRLNVTRAEKPKFCSDACTAAHKKARAEMSIAARFWALVDRRGPDKCWEWKGHRREHGYGWFNFYGRRPMNASRAAYILTHGDVPDDLCVCHSCDNPPCCNPAHLWLGTHADNGEDRERKGRGRRNPLLGEAHPSARLTREQAIEAYESTASARSLAAKWGVTPQAVERIRSGHSWAHATGARKR